MTAAVTATLTVNHHGSHTAAHTAARTTAHTPRTRLSQPDRPTVAAGEDFTENLFDDDDAQAERLSEGSADKAGGSGVATYYLDGDRTFQVLALNRFVAIRLRNEDG